MKCISPLNIKHPSEGKVRLNVPCGKCINCLGTRRNDWTFRLEQEQRASNTSHFITLTYDENHLTYTPEHIETLYKPHLQKFFKKLRYAQYKLGNKDKIRYYAVGEYGTKTQRPHYHAIMFNLDTEILTQLTQLWGKGLTHSAITSPATIRYVTKYLINKVGDYNDRDKPFAIMSKQLGIDYLHDKFQYHRDTQSLTVTNNSGTKQPLPRYYAERMFSKDEKAELVKHAIHKADQLEEREREYSYNTNQPHYKRMLDSQEARIQNMKRKLNSKNKI